MHSIAIIGGGAAGMMAAATLAEQGGSRVMLFEKNSRLGAKVIISGGGRCNLTTSNYRTRELVTHYTRGAHVLKKVCKTFGPKKVRQRFEDHGVRTKQESDGRIFPVSNDGKEVVGMFESLFEQHDIDLHMSEGVTSIMQTTDGFGIRTTSGSYDADRVIITTGGNAYSHTGSTGDGYAFARALGHTVTQLGPSLNSFVMTDCQLHELSGIAFENARIHRQDQSFSSPLLLTHFGISGPLAFILASHTAFEKIDQTHPLRVRLQLHADHDQGRRETEMLEMMYLSPRKTLKNSLSAHFPKRMVDYLLARLSLNPQSKISTLTREQRIGLVDLLGQGIPLNIIGRKPGDEFVTAGGVSTDEINHRTMESLITPGLYFAGEVLNVDGVTGGYNLQRCRASGHIAAKSCKQ